jgi:hypothetical protein
MGTATATKPHPKPQVVCRPVTEGDVIPGTAKSLVTLAEEFDWSVLVTYARGTLPGKTGRVVESIAVRMRRSGMPRMCGLWIDGKFDSGTSSNFWPMNLGELKDKVRTL